MLAAKHQEGSTDVMVPGMNELYVPSMLPSLCLLATGQSVSTPYVTGIHTERVEEMEERLRQDILTEAAQYQQQVLVSDEDNAFNVFNMFQRVTEQDVLTPKAMFDELRNDGFNVVYSRIPITDEKVCTITSHAGSHRPNAV